LLLGFQGPKEAAVSGNGGGIFNTGSLAIDALTESSATYPMIVLADPEVRARRRPRPAVVVGKTLRPKTAV
jgi:hypothetical protein